MAVKNLTDLFEHDLKDIYYAEHRLLEALEQLASEAKEKEIKQAFTQHRKETKEQINRLKKVFKTFGEAPEPEKCPGVEGLLKEKEQFTKKEKPSPQMLEFFNLSAAAKTERYEITAYEGLIEIARSLKLKDAVDLLKQNLDEEKATLQKLQSLSKGYDKKELMDEEEGSSASKGTNGSSKGAAASRPARPSSKATRRPSGRGSMVGAGGKATGASGSSNGSDKSANG